MKVRVTKGQIRFRLDEDEVHRLSGDGVVVTSVALGDSKMTFSLGTIVDEVPVGSLLDGRLSIHLPAVWLVDWPNNGVSGFDFDLEGGILQVLVEKDYPCEHDSDGSSAVPPPRRMVPPEKQ